MSDKLQEAWARVTAQLAEAGARIEALNEGRDPVERAEGYRFLTRVASTQVALTKQEINIAALGSS